jgi:hypothetical protein
MYLFVGRRTSCRKKLYLHTPEEKIVYFKYQNNLLLVSRSYWLAVVSLSLEKISLVGGCLYVVSIGRYEGQASNPIVYGHLLHGNLVL